VTILVEALAFRPTLHARDGSRAGDRPAYDRTMAAASPSPTPNPDAMKFTLDVRLPASINFSSAEAAADHAFANAVFALGGVAAVFGVNDFVTITRIAGADWEPIVAGVVDAAAAHL
jgi:hypothetical protein